MDLQRPGHAGTKLGGLEVSRVSNALGGGPQSWGAVTLVRLLGAQLMATALTLIKDSRRGPKAKEYTC